jgi:hypothetical protein
MLDWYQIHPEEQLQRRTLHWNSPQDSSKTLWSENCIIFLFPILGLKSIHYCQDQRCKVGFFFSIVSCSHTGNHPRGIIQIWYMSEKESKTFQNPAIFWQRAETYCLTWWFQEKKFLQTWQLWITLFTNILCMSCTGLSFVSKWREPAKGKNHWSNHTFNSKVLGLWCSILKAATFAVVLSQGRTRVQ